MFTMAGSSKATRAVELKTRNFLGLNLRSTSNYLHSVHNGSVCCLRLEAVVEQERVRV